MPDRVTFPAPPITVEQRDEIVERCPTSAGSWSYRRDLHLILSFPLSPKQGLGPCGCDYVVAEVSDHPDAEDFARLLDTYHEFYASLLVGPLDSPSRLEHFFLFLREVRDLKKRTRHSPVCILRDVDPATLDRSEPWLCIAGGTEKQRAGNLTFLRTWLDDAFNLAAARELSLMCLYDTDDGERLAIDIGDAELVVRSSWRRKPGTSRFCSERGFLDQFLMPHDPLNQAVIHLNGNDTDFRRHNLAVEDQGETLELSLKPEILERLSQLGQPIELLLADLVGWTG